MLRTTLWVHQLHELDNLVLCLPHREGIMLRSQLLERELPFKPRELILEAIQYPLLLQRTTRVSFLFRLQPIVRSITTQSLWSHTLHQPYLTNHSQRVPTLSSRFPNAAELTESCTVPGYLMGLPSQAGWHSNLPTVLSKATTTKTVVLIQTLELHFAVKAATWLPRPLTSTLHLPQTLLLIMEFLTLSKRTAIGPIPFPKMPGLFQPLSSKALRWPVVLHGSQLKG